ncbi:MAG: sigma-70 family RNA polymerase sigma factor [Planctomycetes bacterium]|nr:sigma-70 family RNA polymerase sigma factor [Planctomycetota bacterium]MCC7397609.1 sigma-70 family RNA polymerase sigma factor [Planctomycetota bacterium]
MDSLSELLAAVRAGSSAARNELLTRFQPRVQGLVHRQLQRRLRPQQHALLRLLSTGDLVTEVLVDVLRQLEHWDVAHEDAFVALLATLVEHRLLDQIRRAQAGMRDVRRLADCGPGTAGVVHEDAGPATLAANAEQMVIYREVLASFPERERALLALRLEDELPWQELADRLAWPSADAARKAFHGVQARLLLRLRQRGVELDGGGR